MISAGECKWREMSWAEWIGPGLGVDKSKGSFSGSASISQRGVSAGEQNSTHVRLPRLCRGSRTAGRSRAKACAATQHAKETMRPRKMPDTSVKDA